MKINNKKLKIERKKTSTFYFLLSTFCIFLLSTFYFLLSPAAPVRAESEIDKLRQQIESRNTELDRLQKEIKDYENQIAESKSAQKTLKGDITSIEKNIKYLNNAVRLAELKIAELQGQIFDLNKQIVNKENDIAQIKKAIAESLQEFYEINRDNLLMAFLRNDTLSDFVNSRYHIENLQSDLNDNLEKFINFQNDLKQLKEDSKQKKTKQEINKAEMGNRKVIVEAERQDKTIILNQTKNQEKVYQQLLSSADQKRKSIEEEIDLLEEKLRKAVDPASLPSPRKGVLEWPAEGILTQEYGATRFAKNHYYSQFHNGIDISLPLGTTLTAAESGTIMNIGDQDKYCYRGAYGKFIVIKHDNNLATLYAHLFSIKVSVGQRVERGDIIGYSGRTGFATGPHLHFTVYDARTFEMAPSKSCGPMPAGGSVDPMLYL